jgi:uncharacterized 2Fe-2S/4Fe-4S cluster protein (DUF4445 family)
MSVMKKNKSTKRKNRKHLRGSPPPKPSKRSYAWLNVLPDQLWLKVRPGVTVWEALRESDVAIDGDCGGLGKCGKCKITLITAMGSPSEEERSLLTEEEIEGGIRLACQTRITKDVQIDLTASGAELEFHQILKSGHRSILELDPLIDKRIITCSPDLEQEWLADLDRIKLCLGPEYRELEASLRCLKTLPDVLSAPGFQGAAVVHRKRLLALQDWSKVGRQYGLVFDLGTSTVVGKLISLLDGHEIAAISRLNAQYKYGTNVVSRLQYIKDHVDGLQHLHNLLVGDLMRISAGLLKVGRLDPDEILIAVAAGNTIMQHILLGLSPMGIAQAPFAPVITDGIVVWASEVGLRLHSDTVLYVMPGRSGYVGGDLISVILASGAYEQDRELALGLDLGTNGEIFLGNRRRLITCSTAAGPALEGARISRGMIAKTGAIEATSTENDRLVYRIIGNTKPKGLCGSGLVDLVAVLLHHGVIDSEGRIGPTPGADSEPLNSRLVERDGVYDFLVADDDESFDGKPVFLTQKDVRELQLAKGAIAAGIETLLDELGITAGDLQRIYLAGALGNYVNVYSAMRIGLLPHVDTGIVVPLGNAATTGASMVLLSKPHWDKANEVSDFVEHVELSSRPDFNDYFVKHLDFPEENIW